MTTRQKPAKPLAGNPRHAKLEPYHWRVDAAAALYRIWWLEHPAMRDAAPAAKHRASLAAFLKIADSKTVAYEHLYNAIVRTVKQGVNPMPTGLLDIISTGPTFEMIAARPESDWELDKLQPLKVMSLLAYARANTDRAPTMDGGRTKKLICALEKQVQSARKSPRRKAAPKTPVGVSERNRKGR